MFSTISQKFPVKKLVKNEATMTECVECVYYHTKLDEL